MEPLPWPFIGSEALARRAIPERSMRKTYAQLYPGVFVPHDVELTVRQRAEPAWLWSRRNGTVAGQSAAAMLGAKWVDARLAAELVHDNRRSPARLIVRTEALLPSEVRSIGAMAVTTARTAFDLGRHTDSRVLAIQRLDAPANATGVTTADVDAVIAAHPGVRGLRRLRAVLPFVDGGAESPPATLTRLVLIDAGLPAPRTRRCVSAPSCSDAPTVRLATRWGPIPS